MRQWLETPVFTAARCNVEVGLMELLIKSGGNVNYIHTVSLYFGMFFIGLINEIEKTNSCFCSRSA